MSSLNEHDSSQRSLDVLSEFSRRRMLQVMGASMALATAAGCRWESEEILEFQRRPEGRVPGRTRRFATCFELAGVASSVFVTSYEGRPIKVEGNPLHPTELGACSARSQASVLDLYDPDHSSGLVQSSDRMFYPRTWKEFDPWFASLAASWRARHGEGLRVLAEPSSSLTLAALRARFATDLPKAKWVEWEPVSRANEIAGAALAFGRAVRVQPRFDAIQTLVTLDADLFGEHPASNALSKAWGRRRAERATQPLRAWAVESSLSITGAVADQRLALRNEQIEAFARALAYRVHAALGTAADDASAPTGIEPKGGFLLAAQVAQFLERLAKELVEHRGSSWIAVGARQPATLHALAHRLNAALGNVGRTMAYSEEPDAQRADAVAELALLTREMQSGAVAALVILGGNPVYDAPVDLEFRRALRAVPQSFHLSHWRDETSRAATWHLPRAHALESWGDARSWDGTRCTAQPLIDRIHERRSMIEFVARLVDEKASARELVRAAVAPTASEVEWRAILQDGFVKDSSFEPAMPTLARFELAELDARVMKAEIDGAQLELVLVPDPKVFDGRGANNAWLEELPNSITKIAWGNAAIFAPATARALGIAEGQWLRLKHGERELEVPSTILPGHAEGSITLHLGYGRTAAGLVGGLEESSIEPIGFDAYRLRTSNALNAIVGVAAEPTGREFKFARTQDPPQFDAIGDEGRAERVDEILREVELAEIDSFGKEGAREAADLAAQKSLWEHDAEGRVRWGMSIDLDACLGCNACVVACQAENNVPVVGREQAARGRSMHWIRIDRYFKGDSALPKLRFQPVTCQHCESAPCEEVCPVAATMHSAEGLNDMVYNRCIGTRYCANNCPFKVRRFNYFNYHREIEKPGREVQRMLYNPEVTLRHRGVMEKCTFCVQRIQNAKIDAKNAGRALADGDVTPACAQTCPTNAIQFGDLADAKSRVARAHADARAYAMLGELNIRPRTAYLAKVNNSHPEAQRDGR